MSVLATRIPQQLSFEVGGPIGRPLEASLKISGTGALASQLHLGDDITVQVVDAAGEIVASLAGTVTAIAFKHHEQTETQPEFVERIQTVKLGGGA